MIEQLQKKVNAIRRKLSLKFLLISYIACLILNIFVPKYIELGFVFVVITTLIWAIKNIDREYSKIRDAVTEYRKFNDQFIIVGLVNLKTILLFIASFTMFLTVQSLINPPSSYGGFFGLFIYMAGLMYAINGEYNPLALEKQRRIKSKFENSHDEYIFSQNIEAPKWDINDTWYSDPCLPGNPIFHINK